MNSRFDKEMIRHCYGVLRVNSFGIETLSGGSGRALFPVTALISHSCQPNVLHNPKSIAPKSCENESDGKSKQIFVDPSMKIVNIHWV